MQLWVTAWPNSRQARIAAELVGLYAEAVDGCALKLIPEAGRRLRRESRYWPSVAEFAAAVELAQREEWAAQREEERRLRFQHTGRYDARDCPQCGTGYEWVPTLDMEGNAIVLGQREDGSDIIAERLLCRCQREIAEEQRERLMRRRVHRNSDTSRSIDRRQAVKHIAASVSDGR